MNDIAFVILTWNSENCIGACLRSIYGLGISGLSGEIIVVDNHSTDGTVDVIRQAKGELEPDSGFVCTLIRLDKNYGTTKSRNQAIRRVLTRQSCPYICVLDSDTEVNAEAIHTMLSVVRASSECAVCGPRMHDRQGVYQRSGRNIPTLAEKFLKIIPVKRLQQMGTGMETNLPEDGAGCTRVGYLLSACWMTRADVFEKVGLFDEKIFYAPEDVEFCIRCLKAGYSIQYCYDADILHEWQRLSRKKLFSRHNWEHIKGLAYMYRKHRFLFHVPKRWAGQAE